ncbi:hypothetical protein ACIBP6_38625 [Nonomuraea terrae]|uniref:hypothetical protein n=1 Tax=Nonomuraea terrae TaxID=2530383 RepID=UPI00378B2497
MAILMPLAPAVITPKVANVVIGVIIAAFLIVPVVVLRRRRWAPRLGAALLALLAVAAAAPVAGLGAPSEEELQRELTIEYALGRPADSGIRAYGSLRFLPWDSEDRVLLAVACVATAALLLALGRAVHGEGRRELLPLRWSRPLTMWGTALVLVSVPQTMHLGALADGSIEHGIMMFDGACFGGMDKIVFALAVLALIPEPLVVASGFGLWTLLARTGHRPLGRVVGWLAVAPLVARDMMMNWMPALGCAPSQEEAANPITLRWLLYTFLPVALILLAVRVCRASISKAQDQPVARS